MSEPTSRYGIQGIGSSTSVTIGTRLRQRVRALCRRTGSAAIVVSALALLAGCSNLQRSDKRLFSAALETAPPVVTSSSGPLSRRQSEAVLKKLERKRGPATLLKHHLAVEQALTSNDLVAGNRVTLLENGPAIYGAMFNAVSHARRNINVETYILSDDGLGREFANLLIRKRSEGVAVNVIYDALGSRDTPRSFFDLMAKAGIRLTAFNPLGINTLGTVNNRDHRKLLIVDGRTVFVGGMNLRAFFVRPLNGDSVDESRQLPWRETDVEIQGPVVATFQKFFFAHWKSQRSSPPVPSEYFPALRPVGNYVVRAIASRANQPVALIYVTLLSAINSAEKSIYITDAYFSPNRRFLNALTTAAKRGVDVEMILPSKTDAKLVLEAGRSNYARLLDAGVKIYERQDYVLHAKTMVIDGVWSTVGSTNLDWRSFLHNDEVNAVVLGRGFGRKMEAMFAADRRGSNRITKRTWDRRSLWERMREGFASMWEWWF